MKKDFELCLFCVDPLFIQAATRSGIDCFIVDWENKGKKRRQRRFNTQINQHTAQDLKNVRQATHANVICRINAVGPHSDSEVQQAISYGADEILIPMVQSVEEVQSVLKIAKGKIKVGILIETNAGFDLVNELNALDLHRIYVGLNDLAIENQDHNIFTPLVDGRLESVRSCITSAFGFGGLTLVEKGHPIPCLLLIGELMRLGCNFSFLRRSFFADILGKELSLEIGHLKDALEEAKSRSPIDVYADHKLLMEKIEEINISNLALI